MNQFSLLCLMKVIEIQNTDVLISVLLLKLAPFNQAKVLFSKIFDKFQLQILPLLFIVLKRNHQFQFRVFNFVVLNGLHQLYHVLFIVSQLRADQSIDLSGLRDVVLIAPLQSSHLNAFDTLAERQIFIFVLLEYCQILG